MKKLLITCSKRFGIEVSIWDSGDYEFLQAVEETNDAEHRLIVKVSDDTVFVDNVEGEEFAKEV